VRERQANVVEGEDAIDRQAQRPRFDRSPDVLLHLVEDRANLLDGTGAEGDADIGDAACGMQVEIEIAVGAAESADIDDAPKNPGRREVLIGDLAGDLVDDQVDTWSTQAGSLESIARSAPNSPRRPRRVGSVEEPITSDAPLSLAICIAIRPTPELAPWISTL